MLVRELAGDVHGLPAAERALRGLAPALLGAAALAAPLCRYTVRDIGFVDLHGPRYRLELEGDPELEPDDALRALARDSNVAFVHRREGAGGAWSLVDEDGRRLRLGDAPLDELASSPLRDRIRGEALDTFAFVVLVTTGDEADDAAARSAVSEAEDALRRIEAQLPRPIPWPLVRVEVAPAERAVERVLLWGLGLEPADEPRSPAAAVVYGRGKLAGPVLAGTELTPSALAAQLALVGESCECDAPRDWVNERSIPLTWGEAERDAAAAELSFDPESPMVQAEVVRILARGELVGAPAPGAHELGTLVFGYEERGLGDTEPVGADVEGADDARASGVRLVGAGDGDWSFDEPASAPAEDGESAPEGADRDVGGAERSSLGRLIALSVAGVGVVAAGLALVVVARSGGR